MLDRLRRNLRRPSDAPEPRPASDDRANRDRDLVLSLAPARIPSWRQLRFLPQVLTNPERRWFRILLILTSIGVVILGMGLARIHLKTVPAHGGTLSIALVGTPQTINPIFARPGTVDYALTKMLFRGLTRITDALDVVPDVAKDISTSADGKIITIHLNNGELWSDGQPLTANDVKFTYDLLKDSSFRSPYQSLFAPITTEVVDDATVRLTTTRPSINLLTTLSIGLLPQHIWLDASSSTIALAEYNIKPVSNGPWKFQNVAKDRSGVIKSYSFIEQKDKQSGAYLHAITIKFYGDHDGAVEAVRKQSVDLLTNITPADKDIIGAKARINALPINQVLGLWFNQNTASVFQHLEVRQAVALTIDRAIADQQLGDQANINVNPILPGYPGYNSNPVIPTVQAQQAQQLLIDAGWKKNSAGIWNHKKELIKFTVTVPNDPIYVTIANAFAAAWKQSGMDVSVHSIDTTTIARDVVRPRLYDVLLFGQQYGADGDLYSYWHSSQEKDPGFALAVWTNSKADQDLQQSHTALDTTVRAAAMGDFQSIVATQVPAVLLTQSNILVAHQPNVRGFQSARVATIGDLFALLPQVYMKTSWAWK